MTIPLKDGTNSQWGRTATDGNQTDPPSQEVAGDNGGKAPLVDGYGRLWVRVVDGIGPPSSPPNVAQINNAATPFVVSASPATLLYINALADDKAWLQVFDLAAAPAVGAVPNYSVQIDKETNGIIDVQALGDPFSVGIVVAWSGDSATYDGNPGGTPADYRARVLWR